MTEGSVFRSAEVPVPAMGPVNGNQRFPEPTGTVGTGLPGLFENLASFLERTRDLPPLRWLIEGLVPDSGRLFIVAAPNAGKTFLALIIAKTAAAEQRPVYLVLEEGRPRSMFDRFSLLSFDSKAPIHIAHLKGVQLNDSRARAGLLKVLKTNEAPVLILDPFSSLFIGDENDTQAMNQAKGFLEEIARINSRALLVLLHHTSKAGERGDVPALYAARGSSILSGWADVQLNLTHEQTQRGSGTVAFVVHVTKGRDGERGQRERVVLTLGEGTVSIQPVGEASNRAGKVLETLAASPTPLTASELAKRVGGRKQTALDLFHHLESEGTISRGPDGYRLPAGAAKEVSP